MNLMPRAIFVPAALAVAACGGPTKAPEAPPSNEIAAAATDAEPKRIAVIVALDRSGSMTGPKMDGAALAVQDLADSLPPDAIFGVVAFDSEPAVLVRPQRAANDDDIRDGLARLQVGGGTDFEAALREAGAQLEPIDADRKLILFLSDGQAATEGTLATIQALADAGITVSTIGIVDADTALLGSMAEVGNGRLYVVRDPARIGAALREEIEAIR